MEYLINNSQEMHNYIYWYDNKILMLLSIFFQVKVIINLIRIINLKEMGQIFTRFQPYFARVSVKNGYYLDIMTSLDVEREANTASE